MKRFFIFVILVILSNSAYADTIDVGVVTVPGDAYSVISLDHDYSDENLAYSLKFNGNMSDKDLGVESIVLRSFEYSDDYFGVNYEPLKNYDLGHGLLVNNLSTDLWHPSFPKNDQSALITSYDGDFFYAEAFGTYSHLYGAQVKSRNIFGLKFGVEAVSDAATFEPTSFSRSATGAFVELPINDIMTIYSEAATSANGGVGALTGVTFAQDMMVADFSLDISAVSFNKSFVPGYFTSGYDVNPLDTASLEASDIRRYGQIATLSTTVVGLFDLDISNENYIDGGTATSWSILLTPTDQLAVSVFQKEFAFSDYRRVVGNAANMIGGSVSYDLGFGTASAIFKKGISDDTDKPYETSYITIGCNI
jgi:hypothetical protein